MVPTLIRCDSCGFKKADAFIGLYVYESDSVQVLIPRRTGWCHSCDSIATIEDLPRWQPPEVPEEAPEVTERMRLVKQPRQSRRAWFSRLFRRNRTSPEKAAAIAKRKEDFLKRSEVFGQIVRARRQENRCLVCGSRSVELFVDLEQGDGLAGAWPNFVHPKCGGNLLTKSMQTHFNIRHDLVVFAPDGRFLYRRPLDPSERSADFY